MSRAQATAMLAAMLSACGGIENHSGFDQPIRVRGGAFFEGALPGSSPAPGDASDVEPLRVSNITMTNRVIYQGQGGKRINGRAPGASAVGIALMGQGTGYWVVPVGVASPTDNNEPTWDAVVDFSRAIPAGQATLGVTAIDETGKAGLQLSQDICIRDRVPDNLHACDPTRAPPDAVISLEWDTLVDLDLVTIGPGGTRVDPKHPAGLSGILDRDSGAFCTDDGWRQEDLIFSARPTGQFTLYADLFDACGQGAVRFVLTVYEAEGDGEARALVRKMRVAGELLDIDADGAQTPGLFLGRHDF